MKLANRTGTERPRRPSHHGRFAVAAGSCFGHKAGGSRPQPAPDRLKPPHRPGTDLTPRDQIQAYCDAVAREFDPERIVLFGSYAYGRPTPDSDVDLLVVLRHHGNDALKVIQIRSRFATPFALDLLVRKPESIVARLRERDMFIELVITQGVVMYEEKHA